MAFSNPSSAPLFQREGNGEIFAVAFSQKREVEKYGDFL
jgi:hypothetical protein